MSLCGLRLGDDVVAALTPPPLVIHLALHRLPASTTDDAAAETAADADADADAAAADVADAAADAGGDTDADPLHSARGAGTRGGLPRGASLTTHFLTYLLTRCTAPTCYLLRTCSLTRLLPTAHYYSIC